MDKKIRHICEEVRRGNHMEMFLPQFLNRLATVYDQYAMLNFTMNYYTFYDSYIDFKAVSNDSTEVETLVNDLNLIIEEYLSSDFSGYKLENCIKRLNQVRNHIISKMTILTSYTDIFQIYEYVLNRVEYRFKESPGNITEEEILEEIKSYIFESEDSGLMKLRIQEILGQLPMRMTKTKFLEMIQATLKLYEGAKISDVNSFLYMLKTRSMLSDIADMDSAFPTLLQFWKKLQDTDYKNISKNQYDELSEQLKAEAGYINLHSDIYYGLMEVINPFYALILSAPYSYMDGIDNNVVSNEDKRIFESLVRCIHERFHDTEQTSLPVEFEEKIAHTEGKQEGLLDEAAILESVFDTINENDHIDSFMLKPFYNSLALCEKLLGNSLFFEINENEDRKEADSAYIIQVTEKIKEELMEQFNKVPKSVVRAIMAHTLSNLPVFFHTKNEVMEYITYALEQCRDSTEKTASLLIIKSFWEN